MTALKEATNVEIILGAKEFFVTTIETSTLKGVIILDWIFYKIAITIRNYLNMFLVLFLPTDLESKHKIFA